MYKFAKIFETGKYGQILASIEIDPDGDACILVRALHPEKGLLCYMIDDDEDASLVAQIEDLTEEEALDIIADIWDMDIEDLQIDDADDVLRSYRGTLQ